MIQLYNIYTRNPNPYMGKTMVTETMATVPFTGSLLLAPLISRPITYYIKKTAPRKSAGRAYGWFAGKKWRGSRGGIHAGFGFLF